MNLSLINIPKCPKCGKKMIKIFYGIPTCDVFEKAEKGELFLDGCMITDNDPLYYCNTCRRSYFKNLKDFIEKNFYLYYN